MIARALVIAFNAAFSVPPYAPPAMTGLPFVLAQGAHSPAGSTPTVDATTPEARMQRRFPQDVRVGDLIGLPVLDGYHQTLGRVRQVVRTPDGKIKLIVAYGG